MNKILQREIAKVTDIGWKTRHEKYITATQIYNIINNKIDVVDENNWFFKIACKWGIEHEVIAANMFEKEYNKKYEQKIKMFEVGLIQHTSIPYMACTPDRICMDNNGNLFLLEIKCPFRGYISTEVDPKYIDQVQHQMEVCNINSVYLYECAFESETDKLLESRMTLYERDSNYKKQYIPKLKRYWKNKSKLNDKDIMNNINTNNQTIKPRHLYNYINNNKISDLLNYFVKTNKIEDEMFKIGIYDDIEMILTKVLHKRCHISNSVHKLYKSECQKLFEKENKNHIIKYNNNKLDCDYILKEKNNNYGIIICNKKLDIDNNNFTKYTKKNKYYNIICYLNQKYINYIYNNKCNDINGRIYYFDEEIKKLTYINVNTFEIERLYNDEIIDGYKWLKNIESIEIDNIYQYNLGFSDHWIEMKNTLMKYNPKRLKLSPTINKFNKSKFTSITKKGIYFDLEFITYSGVNVPRMIFMIGYYDTRKKNHKYMEYTTNSLDIYEEKKILKEFINNVDNNILYHWSPAEKLLLKRLEYHKIQYNIQLCDLMQEFKVSKLKEKIGIKSNALKNVIHKIDKSITTRYAELGCDNGYDAMINVIRYFKIAKIYNINIFDNILGKIKKYNKLDVESIYIIHKYMN